MTPANHKISNFIHSSRYEDLPDTVVHQAKRVLLDTVGCMLAGLKTPIGKSVVELASLFPQHGGATILGAAQNISPIMAAMSNGFLANALDADDGHRASRLHAAGVIIPAAFAAVEQNDCDGRDFIEAVVVGFEIGHRAGIISNSGETYYGSGHGATFGAAAAAGKILNLSAEQTINALGITEIHVPNCQLMGWVNARKIPMIKEGMGWAAATGFVSAMMAAKGITGTLTIFEGNENIDRINSLGSDYEILKRYDKVYPSCRWTHSPLENLLSIIKDNDLDPLSIAGIHVKTFQAAACLDLKEPPTIEDAQYSIPFVLGAALVGGEFGPGQMNPEKLRDEKILELAEKVQISVEPELEQYYPEFVVSIVEVETKDGAVYSLTNQLITGDWNKPFSDRAMEKKFLDFVSPTLSKAAGENIIDEIKRLEQIKSIKEFLRLF